MVLYNAIDTFMTGDKMQTKQSVTNMRLLFYLRLNLYFHTNLNLARHLQQVN